MHYIKHHVVKTLAHTKWARFRDMRPPRVDSNAYSYHLKALLKEGLIEKTEKGYRLSPAGLLFADRMSGSSTKLRHQPKIITMIIVKDENNNVLLLPKLKQPFIGAWVLPHGKIHIEDGTLLGAVNREFSERLLSETPENMQHIADVYIRAYINTVLVSPVLAHIFVAQVSRTEINREDVIWTNKKQRASLRLAPAVEEVITLSESNTMSFKEFIIDW